MRLYHDHYAVLSLLQCESTTNVTIVSSTAAKAKKLQKNPHQIIRNSAAAENRGSTITVASATRISRSLCKLISTKMYASSDFRILIIKNCFLANQCIYSKNLRNIQRYTPITVYQTAPFQTRKILIDLVISW